MPDTTLDKIRDRPSLRRKEPEQRSRNKSTRAPGVPRLGKAVVKQKAVARDMLSNVLCASMEHRDAHLGLSSQVNSETMDNLRSGLAEFVALFGYDAVYKCLSEISQLPPLPSKPPKYWAPETTRPNTNPVQFIKDNYEPWIRAKCISREYILNIDPKLIGSYATWVSRSRHPEQDLNLPSRPRLSARVSRATSPGRPRKRDEGCER